MYIIFCSLIIVNILADLTSELRDAVKRASSAASLKEKYDIFAQTLVSSEEFKTTIFDRKPFYFKGVDFVEWLVGYEEFVELADGLVQGGANGFMNTKITKGNINGFWLDMSKQGKTITKKTIYHRAKDATWLVGSAHTLHPEVSNFTISFQDAFGFPGSTNVYITHPHQSHSVGQHTDRTNAFLFQMYGRKRWQLWTLQDRWVLPLWGVMGDGQWGKNSYTIPKHMVGEQVLDVILEPGDFLYIPRGFIHATSTLPDSEVPTVEHASIAMTTSVNTEGWHMVWEKLLRCLIGHIPGACTDKSCPLVKHLNRFAKSERNLRFTASFGFLEGSKSDFDWEQAFTKKIEEFFQTLFSQSGLSYTLPLDDFGQFGLEIRKVLKDGLTFLQDGFHEFNSDLPKNERQEAWNNRFTRFPLFRMCNVDAKLLLNWD